METAERTPADELLQQACDAFPASVEAAVHGDEGGWLRARSLMLLAQWLCDQAKATP